MSAWIGQQIHPTRWKNEVFAAVSVSPWKLDEIQGMNHENQPQTTLKTRVLSDPKRRNRVLKAFLNAISKQFFFHSQTTDFGTVSSAWHSNSTLDPTGTPMGRSSPFWSNKPVIKHGWKIRHTWRFMAGKIKYIYICTAWMIFWCHVWLPNSYEEKHIKVPVPPMSAYTYNICVHFTPSNHFGFPSQNCKWIPLQQPPHD